jgi:hypothetical protein
MNNDHDVFVVEFEETAGAAGATDNDARQQPDTESKKARGAYPTHGIFSRGAWRALAKAGEDMKRLGQWERRLHEHFQPRGPLQEIAFDRAWCCVLRCVLIGRVEEKIFAANDRCRKDQIDDIVAFAMAPGGSKAGAADQTSGGLLDQLSSVLRYDAFYAKGFLHWIGILVALQNGEHEASVFQLSKKLGNTKAEEN